MKEKRKVDNDQQPNVGPKNQSVYIRALVSGHYYLSVLRNLGKAEINMNWRRISY